MAEFSSNANILATAKDPLFLVSYSYIFCMSFDPVDLMVLSTHEPIANTKFKLITDCMQEVWDFTYAKIANHA